MNIRHGLLTLLTGFLCFTTGAFVFGQQNNRGNPQPQFRNFSVKHGLPSSETYFVHQDKKGYIWICTDRGVARYDGYRFRVFTEKEGLTDNVVFKIHEDKKGRLWFITYNGLLCYWDGQKIRSYKYNNKIKQYLRGWTTTYKSLSIDEKENIEFSAQGLGLLRITHDGKISKQFYEGLWTYKMNGTWIVATGRSRTNLIFKPLKAPVFRMNGRNKYYLGDYYTGQMAYAASNGKRHFLQMNTTIVDIMNPALKEEDEMLVSVQCGDSYLWKGTTDGVLRKPISDFGKSNRNEERYLSGYTVSWSMKDKEGGRWFSTLEQGVFYTPDIDVRTYPPDAKQHFHNILFVAGFRNTVYYSSQDGFYQLGASEAPVFLRKDAGKRKMAILNGICFFSEGSIAYEQVPMPNGKGYFTTWFKDFFIESDTSLLITSTKMFRISNKGKPRLLYSKELDHGAHSQSFMDAVAKDNRGRIFVGSQNGLFERKGSRLSVDHLTNSLFRSRVTDLDFHPAWGVIAATRGGGIYTFRDYKILQHLNEESGLTDNQVNSIYIDDRGVLWATTNKGVSKLTLKKDGSVLVERLTSLHGLPTDEINSVYVYGDKVWVATKNGLVIAYRDFSGTPVAGCCIAIESFQTDKAIYPAAKSFVLLPSSTEYIKILLRSTNFRTGSRRKVRYRYSPDEVWVETTQGELMLTKPRGGDYVLEVMAMNEDGRWSAPEILFRFTVSDPFYATWYFMTGFILIGIFGMYLLFRLRLRQLKRRHRLQDTINQLEQKALRAQMNPHFIFNSLNSIQSFLIYEENEKAEKYLLKFSQLIRITLNNSRETCIPIESEIDSLKRYLELEQMRFKHKFVFEIQSGLTPDELRYGVPPMLIQPFVENAVLHGFKTKSLGGLISLRFIAIKDKGLECIVEDNGVGRKATLQHKRSGHKSFGTKITEERLTAFRQKYGDDFRVEIIDKEENGVAKGTIVVLRIPVVLPHEINFTEGV